MSSETADKNLELLNQVLANWREQNRREEERRAKLSPGEREAEDAARARQQRVEKRRRFEARISKAARSFRGHETLSLEVFGSLLHGIDAAENTSWDWFRSTDADETIAQLASAVGASIRPVNADAPAAQLRFKTVELLAWARGKRFGHVEILARALGAEPPAQAIVSEPPGVRPLPAEATAARSDDDVNHQAFVIAAVEELVIESRKLAGKHKVEPTALPFQHTDIYERYRDKCEARGINPRSDSSVRKIVNKCGYRLAGGNRAGPQRDLLSKLRSKKKPAT